MGLFDKLKNVFFEEEEVEIDEKDETRRIPVAKKIDVSETKKEEPEKEEVVKEEKIEEAPVEPERDFKFPMGFDDKDFEVEKTIEIFGPIKDKEEEEPKVEEVVSDEPPMEVPVEENDYRYEEEEESYEIPAYREEIREEKREIYHKLYEGKEKAPEEKTGFTPSPIISPIYGILNKNYKKEQIVTKGELKKSEPVVVKDELDLVREKAYGDLAGEITASIEDEVIDIDEEEPPKEKEDLLYDLNEEESPTVKTVTVGDAEEYFNDLGLEYNVDYKVEKEEKEEKPEKKQTRVEKLNEENSKDEDDKNLFDLIDAMYEDEDKE